MRYPLDDVAPEAADSAFVSEQASLMGDVTVGERASVWPFACLRGDPEHSGGQHAETRAVRIGDETNVQEFVMVHGATLGSGVTVGHTAVVDHATVEDDVLVGIASVLLSGATVEPNCIVAANSLVRHGQTVPEGHLAYGSPAETKPLTAEQREEIEWTRDLYVERGQRYLDEGI